MPKGRKPLEGSFKNVAKEKVLEILKNASAPVKVKEIVDMVVNSNEYPDAPGSISLHVYNALKDLGDSLTVIKDPEATKRPASLYSLKG